MNIIENPFKTWWKVRKYFKFPRPHIHVGPIWRFPYYRPRHIICFYCLDVTWKSKYDLCRFIEAPQINLILFKKYQFLLTFDVNDNDIYWETILSMVYRNQSIKESVDSNTWIKCGKEEDKLNAVTLNYLTPYGLREYYKS